MHEELKLENIAKIVEEDFSREEVPFKVTSGKKSERKTYNLNLGTPPLKMAVSENSDEGSLGYLVDFEFLLMNGSRYKTEENRLIKLFPYPNDVIDMFERLPDIEFEVSNPGKVKKRKNENSVSASYLFKIGPKTSTCLLLGNSISSLADYVSGHVYNELKRLKFTQAVDNVLQSKVSHPSPNSS